MASLATIATWLAEALGLPFGLKVQNPRPLDAWRGPFDSVADAVATVPVAVRWRGMDVVVNGTRYVWKDGTANNQLVPDAAGLTPAQAEQLAVAGSAVKATGLPDYVAGFETLAAARQAVLDAAGGILEDHYFTVQRPLTIGAAEVVDLTEAAGLNGESFILNSGTLTTPFRGTKGLFINGPGTCYLTGPAHNCYLYKCTVSAGIDALLTDTRAQNMVVEGTLRLGPGSSLDLNELRVVNGQQQPVYTHNPDGTYTSLDGGTVIVESSGGPAGPVLDIFTLSDEKKAQVRALFSGTQEYAADVALPDDAVVYFGKEFSDMTPGGDSYKCFPNFSDLDADGFAKPYWRRY